MAREAHETHEKTKDFRDSKNLDSEDRLREIRNLAIELGPGPDASRIVEHVDVLLGLRKVEDGPHAKFPTKAEIEAGPPPIPQATEPPAG
jgi:hypothetical protein